MTAQLQQQPISESRPSLSTIEGPPVVRFGAYEIFGEISRTATGTVFVARRAGDAGQRQLYALELLHPHLAQDARFVEILLEEARRATGLQHAHVVPTVDFGQQGGRCFVVSGYVEGCSLHQLCLRHGTERPARLLVPLIVDALVGLHAAHQHRHDEGAPHGLVHGCFSPKSIVVGVDGSAHVQDLPMSRARGRFASGRPGLLDGELAFLSPEQLRGSEPDARSDVFAAGAMLWSVLTGESLFEAPTETETIRNVLEKPVPPPSTIGLSPPAVFDAVCARALQRDPTKRFRSVEEMADLLGATALANGRFAPQEESARWIKESIGQELGARRRAIRSRATAAALQEAPSDVDELESLLPLPGPNGGAVEPPSSGRITLPSLANPATVSSGSDHGTTPEPGPGEPTAAPQVPVPASGQGELLGASPSAEPLALDASPAKQPRTKTWVAAAGAVLVCIVLAALYLGSGGADDTTAGARHAAGEAPATAAASPAPTNVASDGDTAAASVPSATATAEATGDAAETTAAPSARAKTKPAPRARRPRSRSASERSEPADAPSSPSKPPPSNPTRTIEANPYVR
jgi:serine/threonine-protein kinase